MFLGDLDGVGGATSQNRSAHLAGFLADLADGFGRHEGTSAVVNVDQAGVTFAGGERGEDGFLPRIAAGNEFDAQVARGMLGQERLHAGLLLFVAVGDDYATNQARGLEGLERMQEDRQTGEQSGDLIVDDGLHALRGARGEENQDVVGSAHEASPISRRICRVLAAGSLSLRMGRPTTMKLEPAAAACAGVITRFWSSPAASG